MIWGSGGSKSRLAKAAGAEPAGQMICWKSARRCGAKHISKSKCIKHTILGPPLEVEMLARSTFPSQNVQNTSASDQKCTPLWREAHFQVKMYKTPQRRTTFGSWDVEKVHAVVARSTFGSQNVKTHKRFGPLLEVQISKKCTPLWREAHIEVKMLKTPGFGPLFEVQMWLRFASLHYITLHYTTLHYTTLHYTTLHNTTTTTTLHYTPLHSTTLHYTKLHYTILHYITLHSTTLHYTTLRYLPVHFTTLHYTTLHHNYYYNYNYTTTLHYNTLHYTPLH